MQMNLALIISSAILLILIVWGIYVRNRIVDLQRHADDAFAGIDVYLTKRENLVPTLVNVCKQYNVFEEEAMMTSTTNRNHTTSDQNQLSKTFRRFRLQVEAYPNLKADDQYLRLMKDLGEIEEELRKSRKYYNGSVERASSYAQQFPNLIIAGIIGFRPPEFYSFNTSDEIF